MKKIIWAVFVLCVITMVPGCGSEDSASTTPAKTAAEVLVPPAPLEGEKVAEIGGCDYLYDQQYAFQFLYEYYPEKPTEDNIYDLVMYELFALEGRDLELSFWEKPADILQHRQDTIECFDQIFNGMKNTLEEEGDGLSGEEKKELQEKITSVKEKRDQYESVLNSILEEEQLSEEEFWQNQQPYIEKYLYTQAYLFNLQDEFEAENGKVNEENQKAFMKYLKKDEKDLREKYHVE
ncbi:MAG TPA: hypothetical protein PKD52_02115 [Clostridiales bacterium]|nr:hypothetical protein [Clostridiales bacterium]